MSASVSPSATSSRISRLPRGEFERRGWFLLLGLVKQMARQNRGHVGSTARHDSDSENDLFGISALG